MEKHQKTPKTQTSPEPATATSGQTASHPGDLASGNNPEHYPNPLANYHKPIYWLPSQIAELAETITNKTSTHASQTVILIDGGSGAGKTTFATKLAELLTAQLVNMDSFYPGWSGLKTASEIVAKTILRPSNRGYHRWCWETMQPKEWVAITGEQPIIIEGCGAITQKTAPLANYKIWYQASQQARTQNLACRYDASYYQPYWQTWLAQEQQHWAENDPANLADVWVQREP